MTTESLKFVADQLDLIGINYEFGQWSSDPIPDYYFVGEYTESEPMNEDGLQESTVLLTGFASEWIVLERAKEKIERNISKTAILPNGNGIAVFYSGALIVPTNDANLKRIQINLTIKEWSVN